jgi:glutamate carboxypeptidase
MNFAGVRQVGDLLRAQSTRSGSDVVVDGPRSGARALGGRTPRLGPKILLIGHLDTVFDSESVSSSAVNDLTAHGPG